MVHSLLLAYSGKQHFGRAGDKQKMKSTGMTVSGLMIYPVKSCQGLLIDSAQIEAMGFQHDRRWMVVDDQGKFVTQRQHPKMALIQVAPTNDQLALSHPGASSVVVHIDDCVKKREVQVWKDSVSAVQAPDSVSEWLTAILGLSCHLVHIPGNVHRPVDPNYANAEDQTGFADGFPFLLTTEASLGELNNRLTAPVTMKHFRPNIVIEGAEPYAEDQWKTVRIGSVEFRVAKPCSRCVMTTVNPETGVKMGKDPLMTLSQYRKTELGAIFGQNLIQNSEGTINVGDSVEVLEFL